MSSNLEGRVAVVFGVANKRSIAWAIAQGLHAAGAKLAVTYQKWVSTVRDFIAKLSAGEKDRVMGGTAVEAYKL